MSTRDRTVARSIGLRVRSDRIEMAARYCRPCHVPRMIQIKNAKSGRACNGKAFVTGADRALLLRSQCDEGAQDSAGLVDDGQRHPKGEFRLFRRGCDLKRAVMRTG